MNMSLNQLVSCFKKLGEAEPEEVAASQIEEGIPHLHRLLFLKKAWERVVSEDDTNWPERTAAFDDATSMAPFAGISHALTSMLEKGVASDEIIDLVRGVQAQLLFDLCYLLEDPNEDDEELEDVIWGLFSLDGDFQPKQPINGLHEDLLTTDPTGREMRPRPK